MQQAAPSKGHYVLTEKICDGRHILVPSVAETLDLSEGGVGSWSVQAPGCRKRLTDVRVVETSEGGLLTADETRVQCAPATCSVAVVAVIDGRQLRTVVDCPSREPHDYTFSLDGPKLTLRMTDRNCALEFTRR